MNGEVQKIELPDDKLRATLIEFISQARAEGLLKSDVDVESVADILKAQPGVLEQVSPDNVRATIERHLTESLGNEFMNQTMSALEKSAETIRAEFGLSKDQIRALMEEKVAHIILRLISRRLPLF